MDPECVREFSEQWGTKTTLVFFRQAATANLLERRLAHFGFSKDEFEDVEMVFTES